MEVFKNMKKGAVLKLESVSCACSCFAPRGKQQRLLQKMALVTDQSFSISDVQGNTE